VVTTQHHITQPSQDKDKDTDYTTSALDCCLPHTSHTSLAISFHAHQFPPTTKHYKQTTNHVSQKERKPHTANTTKQNKLVTIYIHRKREYVKAPAIVLMSIKNCHDFQDLLQLGSKRNRNETKHNTTHAVTKGSTQARERMVLIEETTVNLLQVSHVQLHFVVSRR